MFSVSKIELVIEAMNQMNYILLKAKIQMLRDTIDVLRSNYDFKGPIAYHDQAVITQILNDLRSLEVAVFTIEHDLQVDEVVEISKPFQVRPVE